MDAIGYYYSYSNKSNYKIGNTFLLFETLALVYFYFHALKLLLARRLIMVFSVFFFVLWMFAFIKNGSLEFLYVVNATEFIAVIFLSIIYFFEQIIATDGSIVYNQPRFVVVTAYLIYISGTFFIFLYLNSLNIQDQTKFLSINSILVIIKTILLCIAMSMKNKEKKARKFEIT